MCTEHLFYLGRNLLRFAIVTPSCPALVLTRFGKLHHWMSWRMVYCRRSPLHKESGYQSLTFDDQVMKGTTPSVEPADTWDTLPVWLRFPVFATVSFHTVHESMINFTIVITVTTTRIQQLPPNAIVLLTIDSESGDNAKR